MDSLSQLTAVHSSDGEKPSGFGSGSDIVRITDKLRKEKSSEPRTLALSGESRYLTPLWVFGNEELQEELSRSESSQSTIIGGFELRADDIDTQNKRIQAKISAALKLLTFREPHVIVQFWSPRVVGNHKLLATIDQPFGLGKIEEQLYSYRKDSEQQRYVVDNDHEEGKDLSPPARVLRQGLPEWTLDLTDYLPRQFPQQECAIRCNFHGYLALPVFDSTTRSCVGVLELLTSSKYMSFAYEVRQVRSALKTTDLTTTKTFAFTTLTVHNEQRQNDLERIFSILKVMCDIHQLPLAQTWAVSPFTSFTSQEHTLKKTCNSFDTRCLGKVCMSTASLPFYVQDLRLWPFRKACREQHLNKSSSFVGRALLIRGACFCEDVTKLNDEEYPLVHYAQMSKLTTCFAIFLHSVESNNDYVLEFFLPLNIDDGRHVQDLMQTLKQNIKMFSGFKLGDKSSTQVVGPPTEANSLYLYIDPHNSTLISSTTTAKTNKPPMVSTDSESVETDIAQTNSTHVVNRLSPKQDHFNDYAGTIASTEIVVQDDVIRDNDNNTSNPNMSMQITSDAITHVGEQSNHLKRGRKRKIDSLTMEAVEKHVDKPIDEAAKSLSVSRSTLKRFCREQNMSSWPLPKHNKKTARVTDSKLSQKSLPTQNLQLSSNECFSFFAVVFLLVRVKRWCCSSTRHGFSGRWWSCGKHSYLPSKLDSVYQVARLMVSLKRWKNKKSVTNGIRNRDHPAVSEDTENLKHITNIIKPTLVYPSPKQIVANVVSDIRKVTVKATYKDDIIKFQFPTSSGLLELEKEVSQRIKLKTKRIRLKYWDEDNDLILLACNADLHNLLGYSTSNGIIKLIIQAED